MSFVKKRFDVKELNLFILLISVHIKQNMNGRILYFKVKPCFLSNTIDLYMHTTSLIHTGVMYYIFILAKVFIKNFHPILQNRLFILVTLRIGISLAFI